MARAVQGIAAERRDLGELPAPMRLGLAREIVGAAMAKAGGRLGGYATAARCAVDVAARLEADPLRAGEPPEPTASPPEGKGA